MDCPIWRRYRKNHETRIPASKPDRAVLRQWRPSCKYFVMEHATSDRVSISQADQGTTENDDGTETEATECGRAKEIDVQSIAVQRRFTSSVRAGFTNPFVTCRIQPDRATKAARRI